MLFLRPFGEPSGVHLQLVQVARNQRFQPSLISSDERSLSGQPEKCRLYHTCRFYASIMSTKKLIIIFLEDQHSRAEICPGFMKYIRIWKSGTLSCFPWELCPLLNASALTPYVAFGITHLSKQQMLVHGRTGINSKCYGIIVEVIRELGR